MSHDVAIRGGTVVDGSGSKPVRADVGVTNGRIVEIGERLSGKVEIDATDRLVTPGFIDIHTHYDPQVLWDPWLSPSSWQGVTSVVAGNCGYSLAPTRPESRGSLLRTLDKVEDMRVATLEAGVRWQFETYAEYLKAVEAQGTAINFGGFVGHTPVRMFVMRDDAYERVATPVEIEQMRAVVAESIRAGALGFSSDRAGVHLGDGGRPVPSVVASQQEVEALMRVTADIGAGIVHIAAGENYSWLYDFQRTLGRTITWTSILTYPAGTRSRAPYREKLATHLAGRAAGADVWVQVTCRPITQEFSAGEPTSFYSLPAFGQLAATPFGDRVGVYADTNWRARAWADLQSGRLPIPSWDTVTIAHSPAHPDLVGQPLTRPAAARGCTPFDVICDLAVEDALASRFVITWANDEEDGIALLTRSDGAIMGLSDAGAHVSQICDAVMPTDFLAHWVRDRKLMSIQRGVRKLTGEIADVLHLDRGYIREGAPADLLVLDYSTLDPGPIRRVRDLPADGERLIADQPVGMDHILVNGVPIRRDGRTLDLERLSGVTLRSTAAPS